METGLNAFKEALHLKHVEAGEYSPLALAYIGDAVYELAIRTLVMNRGNMQVNKMHKKTANLVKADKFFASCDALHCGRRVLR